MVWLTKLTKGLVLVLGGADAPRFLASCASAGRTPPHPGAYAPTAVGGGEAIIASRLSLARRSKL